MHGDQYNHRRGLSDTRDEQRPRTITARGRKRKGRAEAVTPEEQIRDDALAEGMECECMRIRGDIDSLIGSITGSGSYAEGQRFILRKLKEIIRWNGKEPQ